MALDYKYNGEGNILSEICKSKEGERELNKILQTLRMRERKILMMRCGIGYDRFFLLKEIAPIFNVNINAIRQIEAKAWRKIGHPRRWLRLRKYLEEN